MKHVTIINGPNLNLLGKREPNIYGFQTLEELNRLCLQWSESKNLNLECFQSNSESQIIEKIHNCVFSEEQSQKTDYFIVNVGAYTHTSVAILDALLSTEKPFYEVHISNIYARENFRHHSFLSSHATATICGLGIYGYQSAINHIATLY